MLGISGPKLRQAPPGWCISSPAAFFGLWRCSGLLRQPLPIWTSHLHMAKAFVRDMRAFFKKDSELKPDELASRQLHILQPFQRLRPKTLRDLPDQRGVPPVRKPLRNLWASWKFFDDGAWLPGRHLHCRIRLWIPCAGSHFSPSSIARTKTKIFFVRNG